MRHENPKTTDLYNHTSFEDIQSIFKQSYNVARQHDRKSLLGSKGNGEMEKMKEKIREQEYKIDE